MATAQGFIQPLAQANTPSGVNNGNPNTVYNTPQTGAQRPLQGWTIEQPVAANLNLSNTAQGAVSQANSLIQNNGWVAPEQTNTVEVPKLTVQEGWMAQAPTMGQTGGTTTPAPTTPTTPAPVDTSNFQWVVMNGKVPGMNQNLYNTDPAYKAAWDQTVKEHYSQFKKNYTKDSSAQAIESRLKALYAQYGAGGNTGQQAPANTTAGGTSAGGWTSQGQQTTQQWVNSLASGGVPVVDGSKGWASAGGGDPAKTSQAISNIVSNFTNLGSSINSSNVKQFLDAITEPFIPGNLYMSELGQVNMQNVLKSVLNQVVPGVGTLAQKIAGAIPDSAGGMLGKIRDWVKEGKFDELANDVYKGARKDAEEKVENGDLDASGPPRSGGGGMGGGGLGGGGGWMFIGGGSGGGNTKTPNISVGEVQKA